MYSALFFCVGLVLDIIFIPLMLIGTALGIIGLIIQLIIGLLMWLCRAAGNFENDEAARINRMNAEAEIARLRGESNLQNQHAEIELLNVPNR